MTTARPYKQRPGNSLTGDRWLLDRQIIYVLINQASTKAIFMTSISGKTTNGFTYEGDYEHANADRVTWTAIFRRSGVFFGMRHGRVNELTGVPAGEISEAVQDDIELVWVQAR